MNPWHGPFGIVFLIASAIWAVPQILTVIKRGTISVELESDDVYRQENPVLFWFLVAWCVAYVILAVTIAAMDSRDLTRPQLGGLFGLAVSAAWLWSMARVIRSGRIRYGILGQVLRRRAEPLAFWIYAGSIMALGLTLAGYSLWLLFFPAHIQDAGMLLLTAAGAGLLKWVSTRRTT